MEEAIANIVIITSLAVLVGALVLAAYSVYHSLMVNKRRGMENGVPVGIIGWCTFIALLAISLPLLLFASFTDMCIITATTMLLLSTGCVIYSVAHASRLRRKR